jgi:hypothetical protein
VTSRSARIDTTRTLLRIDLDAPFLNTIPESRWTVVSGSVVAFAVRMIAWSLVTGSAHTVTADVTRRP